MIKCRFHKQIMSQKSGGPVNRIIGQRLADHLEVLQKLMDSDLPEKLETCAKYVEKALAEGHKV